MARFGYDECSEDERAAVDICKEVLGAAFIETMREVRATDPLLTLPQACLLYIESPSAARGKVAGKEAK